MSAPVQTAARLGPLFRSHRRRWGAALVAGLTLHAGLVAYAAWLRSAEPLPRADSMSFGEVLLIAEPEKVEAPKGDSGGGSIEPGKQDRAEGSAPKPPPKHVVSAVKPVRIPPKAAEPEPPPVPNEELEHGNTDEAEPDDLFALDQLLASEQSDDLAAFKVKARPAWRDRITRPNAEAAPMVGVNAAMSKHYGTGPGRGGGSGGSGRGPNPMREANPFGGTLGAFVGQVCFIPPNTRSIRRLGNCTVEALLHTNSFNIPMTPFTEGFPGVERDEWFAIHYSGKFTVANGGLYHFKLASDDGSILAIDGQEVVDNDGQHAPLVKRGEIELAAGEHDFKLRYFQGPRALVSLQLWVTPPGQAERLFGPRL